jgi:hypothetical protein
VPGAAGALQVLTAPPSLPPLLPSPRPCLLQAEPGAVLDALLASLQVDSALITYNVTDAGLLEDLPDRVANQALPGGFVAGPAEEQREGTGRSWHNHGRAPPCPNPAGLSATMAELPPPPPPPILASAQPRSSCPPPPPPPLSQILT